MLKKIRFQNYRCFKDSSLSLKQLSILVGKNNAGKSTVIEALRLISLAGNKAKNINYTRPPSSISSDYSLRGFVLNIDKLKIDLRAVVHFYEEDTNATITATFDDKSVIEIHINTDVVFAFLRNADDELISTKGTARKCNFDNMQILPQIGLIKESEKKLSKETVVSDRETYLSSRHFRNELLVFKNEYFEEFKSLAESTWPGLRIRNLEYDHISSEFISLFIEDATFTSEIGIMGSGIQMWLQIIWFICRSKDCDTIILDEPDVYMHPDLQRKLIKFLIPKFKQIIIATHSIEIISEVEPGQIVTIDKASRSMSYANSKKSVQKIIESVGSVHNLSLVKIASQGRCVFVEGDDLKILDKLYSRLNPKSDFSLTSCPSISLGGWKNFIKALGVSELFYKESDDTVKCFCILDRDYYPDSILSEKEKLASDNHLNLHIWKNKEIENYLIVPDVLFRISKAPKYKYDNFIEKLERLVDDEKEKLTDNFSQQYQLLDKSLGIGKCNDWARKHVAKYWTTLDSKIRLIPGKDFLHVINQWLNDDYGQSCSIPKIIRNMTPDDIDYEITETLDWLMQR